MAATIGTPERHRAWHRWDDRYPHAIVLVGVVALAKADAATIGVVAPALRADLHVTDAQLGLLAALSSVTGALCALPAGGLVDRRHRPALIAVAVVLWSLALGLAGFATGLALLAVARLLSGGVATIARPVSVSLAGDLYHPHRRGRALAAIDAGQTAGTGLCFILGAVAIHFLSWRWLFWGLAAAGMALALGSRTLEDPAPARPPGPGYAGRPGGPGADPDEPAGAGGRLGRELLLRRGGVLLGAVHHRALSDCRPQPSTPWPRCWRWG